MTLLTMLIALIVERLAVRGSAWQLVTYLRPYLTRGERVMLPGLPQPYLMLLWWLLPALLVSLLIYSVHFWLLQLVLNTLVLLLCIGSWSYRQTYKQFLNAAQRDDQEAAFLAMQQIRTAQGAPELSYGQQLIWLNFRYYAAVLFWYALLGAFGAVAYACLRQLSEPGAAADTIADEATAPAAAEHATPEATPAAAVVPDEDWRRFADDLLHWADWLPVRLFGLGLALVGDFSRTSDVLLQHAGSLQLSAPALLAELSQAAEPVPEELLNTPDTAVSAVALAKRNVLFFLALIAVLTLSGWLS